MIDKKSGNRWDKPGIPQYGGEITPRFQTGYSANFCKVSDPIFDASYPKAPAAADDGELEQVLKDANESVARQHRWLSLLLPAPYFLCRSWLKGFNAQSQAIWMGAGGPSMQDFYAARVWIEGKLKKYWGHYHSAAVIYSLQDMS